ncbi:MAG TPA: hypothetical protein VKR30_04805 [Candidatus Limnocylindrales bacterium]|nr:hypothetical protein [Candidatus Limnocylindrales bacterium]
MAAVRNARELEALPDRSKAARKGALTVIARARREHITIAEAIRREREAGQHISKESVRRYAEAAIARDPRGRFVPTPYDRIYRRLPVLGPEGVVLRDVRSSRRATRNGEHRNAIKAYLEGGDPTGSGIRAFQGEGAGGTPFLTDEQAVLEWGRRRELDDLNQEGS